MKALKRTVVLMMSVLMLIATFSMAFTSSAASKKKVTKVKLNKTSITMYTTQTYTLKATISPSNASNKKVKWTTSNKNVATVSSSGKITAKKKGTATITCTAQDGSKKKATCKVTVTKKVNVKSVKLNNTSVQLKRGDKITLKATISPSNASNKSVSWSSSDKNVAKVDSKGKVTAVANGTATITCKTKDKGKTATCKVTVSNTIKVTSVKLNKTAATLAKGKTLTLTATVSPSNATNKKVTWSSSNTKVATVNSSGKVTAVAAGTATITCKTNNNNKTATCKITVSPTKVTGISIAKTAFLYPENSTKLTATIAPSNADNKTVKWTSSNTKVATVDSTGKITAVAPGTVNITCTAQDGSKKSATCKVTVGVPVTYVQINTTETSNNAWHIGKTSQLTVSVEPENATNKKVTWKSSDPDCVSVDQNGNVKVIKQKTTTIFGVTSVLRDQTVTITAKTDSGEYDEFQLTIIKNKVAVESITFNQSDTENGGSIWYIGDQIKLKAKAESAKPDEEPSDKRIKFELDDPNDSKYVKISDKGVAEPIAQPEDDDHAIRIIARSVDNTAKTNSILVYIRTPQLQIVPMNTNTNFVVGGTFSIYCYTSPNTIINRGVVYEADDPDAITIISGSGNNANLKLNKAGVVKVRFSIKDTNMASPWYEIKVSGAKADQDYFENVKVGDKLPINVYLFDGVNKNEVYLECTNNFSEYIQLNDLQNEVTVIKELPDSGAYLEFTSIDKTQSCKVYFTKGTYKIPATDAEKLKLMKDLSSAMNKSSNFKSDYNSLKYFKDVTIDDDKSSSGIYFVVSERKMSLSKFLEILNNLTGSVEDEESIEEEIAPDAFVNDMFKENEIISRNTTNNAAKPNVITTNLSNVSGFDIVDQGSTYTIKMSLKNQDKMSLNNISASPYATAMPVIDKTYLDNYIKELKNVSGEVAGDDEILEVSGSYGTVNEACSDGYVKYTVNKFTGKVIASEYHNVSSLDVSNASLDLMASVSDLSIGNLKILINMKGTFSLDVDNTVKMSNITY